MIYPLYCQPVKGFDRFLSEHSQLHLVGWHGRLFHRISAQDMPPFAVAAAHKVLPVTNVTDIDLYLDQINESKKKSAHTSTGITRSVSLLEELNTYTTTVANSVTKPIPSKNTNDRTNQTEDIYSNLVLSRGIMLWNDKQS